MSLPLDDAWPELEIALKANRNLVIVAEPGAGKTTRFPPRLLSSGFIKDQMKVLMLEPRRLAARAAAHRIAFENHWIVGKDEIGYQVRFENRTTPQTRLQILTEGLLAKRLQNDNELKDIGAVILDEFHERSQHTDLAIGLLLELQELSRPDLRIIVMSATLDAEKTSAFLGQCPIVRVPGRTFPVDLHYGKRPLSLDTGHTFIDQVSETVLDCAQGRKSKVGDILVFLPGAREIRGVRERLQANLSSDQFEVLELHGSLSLEDQNKAIQKSSSREKIILATNIAETSLTIDGVGTVVDTGLARVLRVDGVGFSRLQISRISMASAKQRAGRAGRQGPGICHRFWSKLDEASMPEFESPEILRGELTDTLMTLLSQGVSDPYAFSWFERPDDQQLRSSLAILTDLGFRSKEDGALTQEGREALKLPLSPRLAKLVIEAAKLGEVSLGAKLASLLSEKDFVGRGFDLKKSMTIESDVIARLHLLEHKHFPYGLDAYAIKNIYRVVEAIESAARRVSIKDLPKSRINKASGHDEIAMQLLLLAFPDRLSRRRRKGEPALQMVGGKGSRLAPFSTVETAELLLALDSYEPGLQATKSDAQISIASRVERVWIDNLFPSEVRKKSSVTFDDETDSVQVLNATFFRDLPLESPHIGRPNADEAFPILIERCLQKWDVLFASHESLAPFFSRLKFLEDNLKEHDALNFDFDIARKTFLEEICYGETRIAHVLGKDLESAFTRHLPPATAKLLDEAAPSHWTAPSGSRVKISYPLGRPPQIDIRIQEVFGLGTSPRIGLGHIPIVMHLLGPNFRPAQVTADLESFWRNGYSEVRKELRARYPKHSWPEDPWSAPPTARGGRRRS